MSSAERPVNGQPASDDAPEAPPEKPPGADLSELRSLLFGPDQKEIRRIQQRLEDPQLHAQDVSRVLPDAITLRSQSDARLAEALAPTIQNSFKIAIRNDPQTLVDAISPIMGPAIRKSISDTLQRMIQSLNQALEYGLSPKGIKWRLQAYRTGKPFAEVVLLNTLQYRVEQVFLIHRKTGLLLQHVCADVGASQNADMISGMFTAIQDFVRDSFGVAKGESLEQARVGELTIWLEQTPDFILAAVVRGIALQTLRNTLQETAEKIQVELRGQLDCFEGDAAPFEASRPYLEPCLLRVDRNEQPAEAGQQRKMPPSLWIAIALAAVALGAWAFTAYRAAHQWSAYLDRLSAEPGIVLTDSGKRNGKWYVQGLRDSMAANPDELARESGIDPQTISSRWELYDSFVPSFVLARARAALAPPLTVSFQLDDGILRARGTASAAWNADARRFAPFIPGVLKLDDSELTQLDQPAIPTQTKVAP